MGVRREKERGRGREREGGDREGGREGGERRSLPQPYPQTTQPEWVDQHCVPDSLVHTGLKGALCKLVSVLQKVVDI